MTRKGTTTFRGAPFLVVEFEVDGKPAPGGEPGGQGIAASVVQRCWDTIVVGEPLPRCWPLSPGFLAAGDGPGP